MLLHTYGEPDICMPTTQVPAPSHCRAEMAVVELAQEGVAHCVPLE